MMMVVSRRDVKEAWDLGQNSARRDLIQAVKTARVPRLQSKSDDRGNHRGEPVADHAGATARREVMKPLATPVIGGMVSSLIHILIVTPVILRGCGSGS